MSISHLIHNLFSGPENKAKEDGKRQEWRDAIHENRNEVMRSSGAAKMSQKASDEALRVQKKAIKLLECIKDKKAEKE